ncbi:ribonuclease E activity regulator RraA [Methyloversatilis sp. XJ19-49]|uniref:ribonuclease E activity regulator RraA n=1 Tax=Methyloversatilis sp. XJ19-49 TaxID=2963429 RepID=UPI00211B800E|nr:ribonuclease E activity regulator RraA [Methyloversatilis sp. XJ19-49]MCQ9379357.1 ribonuclease E activity regulator RraA [Methyloversatilis sp. XJ19-49]
MTIQTADLCDQFEAELQVCAPMFRSFGGHCAFGGPISTLKLFEDNGLVRKALETPGNGKVLVVDGGGSMRRALVGDQIAALAVKNGWAGIVVYGCIRDSAAISQMNIGVMALGTHPLKTVKRNEGQSDITISFGGIDFVPGHYLYADGDGVIVSKRALI